MCGIGAGQCVGLCGLSAAWHLVVCVVLWSWWCVLCFFFIIVCPYLAHAAAVHVGGGGGSLAGR